MPKNTHYIVAIIFFVLLVNTGSIYFGQKHAKEARENELKNQLATSTETTPTKTTSSTPTTPTDTKSSTAQTKNITTGFYSYANASYNFSIQYPSYVRPLTSFATFHEIGNNWRLYAEQANQGKSIVSFSIKNIDQGIYSTGKQTYPLYFTAEVRVGVSQNIKECYSPDVVYPNQKVTNTTINGVPFKKFSTLETVMERYTLSESYRTIHNNSCYVIEQIKSGTTYRDEKMITAYTDTQLNEFYNVGEKIVKTFKFTK